MSEQDRRSLMAKIKGAIEQSPYRELINKASLFGSYAYGVPRSDSDVDLLVEFDPAASIGFFKLSDIRFNLEEAVGKKIDLLTLEAISKYFRNEVAAKAQLVYEK